jgi:hypothetical protein
MAGSAVDDDHDCEEQESRDDRCQCRDCSPGLVEAEDEDNCPEREVREGGGPAEQVREPVEAS